jgi:hypothetical protein
MKVARPAAPEERCIDCNRKFDPGENGLMLRHDIGPFIACIDREACEARVAAEHEEPPRV